MKKTDSSINGVTIRSDNNGGCWCEKNMHGVSGGGQFKTCFLKDGELLIRFIVLSHGSSFRLEFVSIKAVLRDGRIALLVRVQVSGGNDPVRISC